MFSIFKIMLTISYTTAVTLCGLFERRQNVLNTTLELDNRGRPFQRCIRLELSVTYELDIASHVKCTVLYLLKIIFAVLYLEKKVL